MMTRKTVKSALIFLVWSAILPGALLATTYFNQYGPANGIQKNTGASDTNTAATSADILALWTCSNTQLVFDDTGALACSSLMTFNKSSVVLNLGAATTPGTFSVGQLDSMVVNGVAVPIPGFALNSNIQGVIENHSYVGAGPGGGSRYYGVRSRGTISAPTIVATGDNLATFYAAGYNGSNYSLGGQLQFIVDGTPGAAAMPTDACLSVSPSASQTPTERFCAMNDGSYRVSGSVGTSGQVLTSGGAGAAASWTTKASGTTCTLTDISANLSATGFVTPTFSAAQAQVCGNLIVVSFQVSGTSNATSFTVTGFTALGLNPTTTQTFAINSVLDNGTAKLGCATISGDTMTFKLATTGFTCDGTWTASSTKGNSFGGAPISYTWLKY